MTLLCRSLSDKYSTQGLPSTCRARLPPVMAIICRPGTRMPGYPDARCTRPRSPKNKVYSVILDRPQACFRVPVRGRCRAGSTSITYPLGRISKPIFFRNGRVQIRRKMSMQTSRRDVSVATISDVCARVWRNSTTVVGNVSIFLFCGLSYM